MVVGTKTATQRKSSATLYCKYRYHLLHYSYISRVGGIVTKSRKNPRPIKLDYSPPVHFAERFTDFMIEVMQEAKGTPYWTMQFDDILFEYEMTTDDWFDDLDEGEANARIQLIDILEDKRVILNYGGGVVDFYGVRYNFFRIPVEFEVPQTNIKDYNASKFLFRGIFGGGYWSVYRPKIDDAKLKAQYKKLSKLQSLGAPTILLRSIQKEIDLLELKQVQMDLLFFGNDWWEHQNLCTIYLQNTKNFILLE